MKQVKDALEKSKDRFTNELLELLRIPSISADPSYKDDVLRCAEFVKEALSQAGADNARILPTPGYPVVYAEKIISKDKPTVLIYGHYDVQPVDPLNLWDSPPFEPVIKNDKVYARGAADDKGQFYMHVKAFEIMQSEGLLPCNVKFLIEGEEEVGSEHLEEFIEAHKELLKADVVLISDTALLSNENPSLTTGLRGLCYMQVELTGPNRDLHSGIYGGAVANPINMLAKMISSLHDEHNRVNIPGFYDSILPVTDEERKLMSAAPFSMEAYCKALNIDQTWGEQEYSVLERTSIRPTLDVNGIWGGYTGEGAKTVLPSKAFAKISMRLVPGQDHKEIAKLFSAHIESIAPPQVKVIVTEMHGGPAAVTPVDSKAYLSAAAAMKETFGKEPIPLRSGGSIPIVALFEKSLNCPTVLMGFGLDSDAIHSPNEHYGLFNYFIGIETIPWFFHYFAL